MADYYKYPFSNVQWFSRTAMLALLLSIAQITAGASEVHMLHDIPSGHPRLKYYDDMVAQVRDRTQDGLIIKINPDGESIGGEALVEAVRVGRAQLAWVNTAHLERIDERLGFANLPFSLTDDLMSRENIAGEVIALMNRYLRSSEIEALGVMRAADQICVFRALQPKHPKDLVGARTRISGAGTYLETMSSFGMNAIPMSLSLVKGALQDGKLDGMCTSPGGWVSTVGMAAPNALVVPGLSLLTYSLIVNRRWFEGLKSSEQEAVREAATKKVTSKWSSMRSDDELLIQSMISSGANVWVTPASEREEWRTYTRPVTKRFGARYPDVINRLQEILAD